MTREVLERERIEHRKTHDALKRERDEHDATQSALEHERYRHSKITLALERGLSRAKSTKQSSWFLNTNKAHCETDEVPDGPRVPISK